jgi:hypothetical protein
MFDMQAVIRNPSACSSLDTSRSRIPESVTSARYSYAFPLLLSEISGRLKWSCSSH